jgi:hypothetical protein
MAARHPLNQAVLDQALNDLRHGQLRRCQAMGFSARVLQGLKDPALVSLLANSKVSWVQIKVNLNVMHKLLDKRATDTRETQAIDRMLTLGGSTELVSKFYGLSHQEVAIRRQMLEMPERKGRWADLEETKDGELWRAWQALVKERKTPLNDDTAVLEIAMVLAESLTIPLAVVWNAISEWTGRDPV